ncbi:MAG: 2-amino-4-hydroxy-6-hydroxymethyldihydropteridine diphosphokinase [Myxococcales bacterium]|nr:2-amino-4-hydroxy-6-hydroxymethyldihydropteridine diphosphokinase [Myxococcales bacterium]
MSMRRVVFGLGSNLGGRFSMLRAAHDLFAYAFDGNVTDARVRITAPVGPVQPDFANCAVLVRSDAPPEALLSIALRLEEKLGRERSVRWGPRTIDVDVLWIEGEAHESESLIVPHARLRERTFALAPLVELAPDASDPRDGAIYQQILRDIAPNEPDAGYELRDGFDTIEVLDHTADEGFDVKAIDRADLLAGCAEALGNTMVHRSSVRPVRVLPVEARAAEDAEGFSDDSERMHAWLAEVLYTLDAKRFAARRVCVTDDGPRSVRGLILGEPLDESRHEVGTAVKAITYHDMRVGPVGDDRWEARVIVDV